MPIWNRPTILIWEQATVSINAARVTGFSAMVFFGQNHCSMARTEWRPKEHGCMLVFALGSSRPSILELQPTATIGGHTCRTQALHSGAPAPLLGWTSRWADFQPGSLLFPWWDNWRSFLFNQACGASTPHTLSMAMTKRFRPVVPIGCRHLWWQTSSGWLYGSRPMLPSLMTWPVLTFARLECVAYHATWHLPNSLAQGCEALIMGRPGSLAF